MGYIYHRPYYKKKEQELKRHSGKSVIYLSAIFFAFLLLIHFIDKDKNIKSVKAKDDFVNEINNKIKLEDVLQDKEYNSTIEKVTHIRKHKVKKHHKKISKKIHFINAIVEKGYIIRGYGSAKDRLTGEIFFHTGLDIVVNNRRREIASISNGKVIFADKLTGYNYVVIIKKNNTKYIYGHLKDLYVQVGDNIKKGELLGKVIKSKEFKKYVLHFEIRKAGKSVNPLHILK